MNLQIKGKLAHKLEKESGTSKAGKDWEKQSFVIDTGAQYNPLVCFSLFGSDKIALLNGLKKDDEINVSFNISSREFKDKYYHSIDAWKIDKLGNSVSSDEPVNTVELPSDEDDDDSLPF